MNTYYFNDENFMSSEEYKRFMENNSSQGELKIRAYSASEAIPVEGLKVIVSALVGNDKVIFFEGVTDESGVIDNIMLPAPVLNPNNLEAPTKQTYDIEASYVPDNIKLYFKANIYENVCVVQNINIIPDMVKNRRWRYGR